MRTLADKEKEEAPKRNNKVISFQQITPKKPGVMRPGKTKKDKTETKAWFNRFENQQARVNEMKESKKR